MIGRLLESMFHWFRMVGEASPGGRALEPDGVVAAIVPAAYEEIGASWTVWVPPGDAAAAALLETRGHVLDAEPMAMP